MMIQTFAEAEKYLATLPLTPRFTGNKRLGHVEQVLDALGSPQDAVPAIHVAGTSGKGSTSYYASHLLSTSGYTVGLVVSPHVNCVAERAQINSQLLPEAEYCRYLTEFIQHIDQIDAQLTYLEFLTIFAYWLFAAIGVDYMVIEVGIGGRLDTTNVMHRLDKVAVITDIGLDHTEILGDTLPEIAREKAGIITRGSSVVMYHQGTEIKQVVDDAIKDRGAELQEVTDDIDMPIPLPSYQVRNSRLALAAVNRRLTRDNLLPVTQEATKVALKCVIPGRFEMVGMSGVPTLLDAAHNPQKMQALTEAYHQVYPDAKCVVVAAFGANKSTTVADSLQVLRGCTDHLIATEFVVEGMEKPALAGETLASMAKDVGFEVVAVDQNPRRALDQAVAWARRHNAMIIVTGSFYLISMLRDV